MQHGNTVANLPKGVDMAEITLDEAVALLASKGKVLKAKPGRGKKAAKPKAAPKTAAAKSRSPATAR